jgi:hypothetical protein
VAATKKTSSKNLKRQSAQSQLPFKVSAKKQMPKPKKTSKPNNKRRTVARKKRVILKQVRIPLGPRLHIHLQLKRTAQSKVAKKVKPASKPPKTSIKNNPVAVLFITGGLVGTVFFAVDLIRHPTALVPYAPPVAYVEATKPTEKPKTTPVLTRSEPLRLVIADVGIDAPLTSVSKGPDNTLQVPPEADVPGWYRLSPTPGELGPSIIVGHVDSESGPAVFWRLRELTAGQTIEIMRANKSKARFEVVSVRQFEQKNFPTKDVYGNINYAGLRLITCGGTFNRITGHYSHNTVIFAKLVK